MSWRSGHTNAQVLAWAAAKAELVQQHAAGVKAIRDTNVQLARLDKEQKLRSTKIDLARETTKVVNGIALFVGSGWRRGEWTVHPVGCDVCGGSKSHAPRSAEVYPVARMSGGFGLKLGGDRGISYGSYYGSDWREQSAALAAAIRWVLDGIKPTDEETQLEAALLELGQDLRWTKTQLAAFQTVALLSGWKEAIAWERKRRGIRAPRKPRKV